MSIGGHKHSVYSKFIKGNSEVGENPWSGELACIHEVVVYQQCLDTRMRNQLIELTVGKTRTNWGKHVDKDRKRQGLSE